MNAEWYTNYKETLEKSKHEISKADFRFYNISRLLLIAQKTLENRKQCKQCDSHLILLESHAQNLKQYIQTTNKKRKDFDIQLNRIIKHLRKEHGITFAFYYTSLFTFLGLLTGIVTGTIVLLTLSTALKEIFFLIFVVSGLAIGRIFGYFKDKKAHKNNKQI